MLDLFGFVPVAISVSAFEDFSRENATKILKALGIPALKEGTSTEVAVKSIEITGLSTCSYRL